MNLLNVRVLVEYFIIILLFTNCSASTGTRYDDDEKPAIKDKTPDQTISEDFDITPYKVDLTIVPQEKDIDILSEAWFDYSDFSDKFISSGRRKIAGTTDGYRIVVVSTDNLEEANKIKLELSEKLKMHESYISFEPPFYKVKVGDLSNLPETNDLKFKLNQLGYKEARIVQETVNIFEE